MLTFARLVDLVGALARPAAAGAAVHGLGVKVAKDKATPDADAAP